MKGGSIAFVAVAIVGAGLSIYLLRNDAAGGWRKGPSTGSAIAIPTGSGGAVVIPFSAPERIKVEPTVIAEERIEVECPVCERKEKEEEMWTELTKARNRANDMARQGLNRMGSELTVREERLLWEIAPGKSLDSLVVTPKAFELMDKMIDNQHVAGHLSQMDGFSDETSEALDNAHRLVLRDLLSWKEDLFHEFNWQ